MNGLERGRQVRSQRHELRQEIAAAEDPAAAVASILERQRVPRFLSSMSTIGLVRLVPGIGKDRGERLIGRAGLPDPHAQVSQMSFSQRVILGHELRKR